MSAYSGDVCATSGYEGYEQVTVTKTGTGAGTVASTPAGINCGTACSAAYLAGASVTLTATPASGSVFSGWSGGGCIGTAPCTVAGSGSIAVTATFSLVSYTLTVVKSGPGTVASAPSGITCGSICSKAYPSGTVVTLTATPNRGATFTGWSGGGCAGTGPTCVVSVKTATWVWASFKYGRGK